MGDIFNMWEHPYLIEFMRIFQTPVATISLADLFDFLFLSQNDGPLHTTVKTT